MSHEASLAAWQLNVTPTEKLILLALANYATEDGTKCFPGQRKISAMTCLDERSVRRTLAALDAKGYILRSPRRRANGTRTSDEYELIFIQAVTLSGSGKQPDSVSDLTGQRVRAINRKRNRKSLSVGN